MADAKPPLDDYLREAGSWADDLERRRERSQRIAWGVAAAASLIAVCEAIAIVALTPLKTVQPYTLLVDRQTGFVQALKPLETQQITPDAALTQSFLVQYVIAREGYDLASVQADYRKVGLWSSGQARADYLTSMQASNPASPLAMYPRTSVVSVEVKSVSPLGRNTALVRFDTQRQDRGGQPQAPRSWVTVIRYQYTQEAMSAGDRFINPLGFHVTSYRRSPENLAPSPSATLPTGQVPTRLSDRPGAAENVQRYPRTLPDGAVPR